MIDNDIIINNQWENIKKNIKVGIISLIILFNIVSTMILLFYHFWSYTWLSIILIASFSLTHCFHPCLTSYNLKTCIFECLSVGFFIISFYVIINSNMNDFNILYFCNVLSNFITLGIIKISQREYIRNKHIILPRQILDVNNFTSVIPKEYEICNELCVICQDNIDSINGVKTICSHYFHKACIRNWVNVKNECPICKYKFGINIVVM